MTTIVIVVSPDAQHEVRTQVEHVPRIGESITVRRNNGDLWFEGWVRNVNSTFRVNVVDIAVYSTVTIWLGGPDV